MMDVVDKLSVSPHVGYSTPPIHKKSHTIYKRDLWVRNKFSTYTSIVNYNYYKNEIHCFKR